MTSARNPGGDGPTHRNALGGGTLPRALTIVIAATTIGCAACGSDASPAGPSVEMETIGDTTIVRTLSGSVWGAEATLVLGGDPGRVEGRAKLFGSGSRWVSVK